MGARVLPLLGAAPGYSHDNLYSYHYSRYSHHDNQLLALLSGAAPVQRRVCEVYDALFVASRGVEHDRDIGVFLMCAVDEFQDQLGALCSLPPDAMRCQQTECLRGFRRFLESKLPAAARVPAVLMQFLLHALHALRRGGTRLHSHAHTPLSTIPGITQLTSFTTHSLHKHKQTHSPKPKTTHPLLPACVLLAAEDFRKLVLVAAFVRQVASLIISLCPLRAPSHPPDARFCEANHPHHLNNPNQAFELGCEKLFYTIDTIGPSAP